MKKNEIKQIILEEIKSVLSEMGPDPELYPDGLDFPEAGGMSPEEMAADSRPEEDEMDMGMDMDMDLEEMARTPNVFALAREASMRDVLQFMQRVNDKLKTYKSPGQKKPKKRFTPEEMKALAVAMVNPEGFTSKDIIAATSYNSPAQANKFLAALEQKGLIKLISQLKKAMDTPAKPKAAPDVDDFEADIDMSDFEDLDLSDPFSEAIKRQVSKLMKEAKSPLAKKMKEVESRGRIAALETKLAAVQEMIEETEGRLTRIDEDNEFADMMDKSAVKEVRKQLKELERAQAKLQKEYDKVSGGRRREKVVDEVEDEGQLDEIFGLGKREGEPKIRFIRYSKAAKEYEADDSPNIEKINDTIAEDVGFYLRKLADDRGGREAKLKTIPKTELMIQYGPVIVSEDKESISSGIFGLGRSKQRPLPIGVLGNITMNFTDQSEGITGGLMKAIAERIQNKIRSVGKLAQVPSGEKIMAYFAPRILKDNAEVYMPSGGKEIGIEIDESSKSIEIKFLAELPKSSKDSDKGTRGRFQSDMDRDFTNQELNESILRMQKLAGLIKG